MELLTVISLLLILLTLTLTMWYIGKRIPLLKLLRVTFSKINTGTSSLNNGGQLVALVLKEHKVQNVYTLCGGHISPILVACEKNFIRVIDTRHEATCVFAADADARISGNIGVAIVTAGPGATNTITAVKNAQMAQTPLLILSGAAALLFKGRGSLQDIDQLSLFKSTCKYTVSISRLCQIVPTIRNAIQIAKSGTPGPVFVEFPIDTLYPYDLLIDETLPKNVARNFSEKIISYLVKTNINDIFVNAFQDHDLKPLPISFPIHKHSQVGRVIKLFQNCSHPLIILSSQLMLHSVNSQIILKSLDNLGVPCFSSGMARGLLGIDSPFLFRHRRRDALKEADLILLAGAVCDFRLEYGKALSNKSKIVIINRNYDELIRNTDVIWKPNISILGDPAKFLVSLSNALSKANYSVSHEWILHLKERDEAKEMANLNESRKPVDKYLNPIGVLFKIRDCMDKDSVIVVDGGDFVGSASYILKPNGPFTWLDPGPFGTLGVGGGFALGAKLCKPKSEVWLIYGDGSLGYSIAEFDTFVRHQTPVIAVVGNDACWSQIERAQVKIFKSDVACSLRYSNYEEVASGYGGVGFRVEKDDQNEIKNVLEQAKNFARAGKPVLINFIIGKSAFREGSLSV